MTTATKDNTKAIEDIAATWDLVSDPSGVVEVRALLADSQRSTVWDGWGSTVTGYFDDKAAFVDCVTRLDASKIKKTIYVTLNPAMHALKARANNRLIAGKKVATTADDDIVGRRLLLIDADPYRPSNISSTQSELDAALSKRDEVVSWLRSQGFPAFAEGMSANGGHAIGRIDLPNDGESTRLVNDFLECLNWKFGTTPADSAEAKRQFAQGVINVGIDTTVFNASRITKLYGTLPDSKGDDTDDRPHRRSAITFVPDQLDVIPAELLERVAQEYRDYKSAQSKPSTVAKSKAVFSANGHSHRLPTGNNWCDSVEGVEKWLDDHGVKIGSRESYTGNGFDYKWDVDCITSSEHTDGAAIMWGANKGMGYKCHHNSCKGKGWADVRNAIDPGGKIHQTGAELYASLREVAGNIDTAAKNIDPSTGEILDGAAHSHGHSSATAAQSTKLRMTPGRRIKHTKDGVTRVVRIKELNAVLTVDGGPNIYDAEYADDAGAWWPITVSDDDEITLMVAEAPKTAPPAAPKAMTWDEIAREIARITAAYDTPEDRQIHIVDELSAHIAACERSKHTLLVAALQMANAGFTKTDATKFIDNCVRDAKKAAKQQPKKTEAEIAAESGVNTCPYGIEDGCIVEYWTDDEGEVKNTKLCNFNAWIVADVAVDDGEGINRKIVIGGKLGNGTPLPEVEIKADEFESMQWVVASWGARANIAPGKGSKDTLRHAIQTLSAGNMQQRTSRAHTGWAVIDGKRVFVHNDGAIGGDSASVTLPHQLHGYRFPTDNAVDPVEAMRESIKLMDIANAKISAPLWASMYLAPLSELIPPVFTISVEGGSGSLKSSFSAVMLNHYGPKFEENKTMPADWLGTANSLEKLCYHTKDVVIVIDDLRPTSSPAEYKELMAKVNHIVRAVGNRQGRSRLDSNSDFKRTYAPRGVVIITAERKAMGKSTNSRILTLDVEPGDIDSAKLSVAQRQRHIYSYAMAGYIQWVADNWDALESDLPNAVVDTRAQNSVDGQHKRLPNATAVLYVAFDTAMTYAIEIGAITEDEAAQRLSALQKALAGIAETQNEATEEEDPAIKYVTIIATLIAQEKAYILAKGDNTRGKNIGTAFGERLGWYDGANVYLLPGAYNAVCKYASAEGWIFPSDEPTLRKELARAGYITKTDAGKLTSNQRIPDSVEKKPKPVTAISYTKFADVLKSMGVDVP